MKKCIWCLKTEEETLFNRQAHTIPQSLGGKNICENVCDGCNSFFGNALNGNPSIEVVLKEGLNISKHILLNQVGQKPNKHYTSEYFSLDFKNRHIKIKLRYAIIRNFQIGLGRLFRRGFYKVYLEERERQLKDSLHERFNFIRDFAFEDKGDLPLYIKIPTFKAILLSIPDIKNPEIRFTESSDKLEQEYNVYEYLLMGHWFVIPTSPEFSKTFSQYLQHIKKTSPTGEVLQSINNFEDLDFLFSYMRD